MFFFYALSFEPFLLILLAGCLGVLLGNRTSSVRRVRVGVLCVGVYLTAVLLVSAYFWPLWTGQVIPYEQWYGHMWIPTWNKRRHTPILATNRMPYEKRLLR